MRNKLSMFLAVSLLATALIPTMANAGNVKKKYINIAKDGEQATESDLGNIKTAFGSVETEAAKYVFNHSTLTGGTMGLGKINNTAYTTYVPDQNGMNLEFKGSTNSFVAIPLKDNSMDAKRVTIEAKVYPTQPSSGYAGNVFAKENSYLLAVKSDKVYYAFWSTTQGWGWVGTSLSVPLNQWSHIALSWDGDKVRIYANGSEQVFEHNDGDVHYDNTFGYTIGSRGTNAAGTNSSASSESYIGLVKEVRLWSKYIPKAEIDANKDKLMTGNEPGLIGLWNFQK